MGKKPRRRASGRKRRQLAKVAPQPRALQYKVVELSTVDEGSLERTVNEWVSGGWTLENVQFAMRESSKRPSMAFVFFTREGQAELHDDASARAKLRRLAEATDPVPLHAAPVSAYERLRQLAGEDEPDNDEGGEPTE